ncbi:MAG: hypothetical protein M3O15_11270, partial [Acidobacteriota bacterium]|nr:hypothetical protein [Acidobacteriota bacterium]
FEAAVEEAPGLAFPVLGLPGFRQDGIGIVTNRQIDISNFGFAAQLHGFTNSPPGSYYAVRFPGSQIAAIEPGHDILIQAGTFLTFVDDHSAVPLFAEAFLATGSASGGTATLDLAHPLARTDSFLAKDRGIASFYFPDSEELGRRVRKGIAQGSIHDLFLVLRLPTATPFPGVHGLPPQIGLDAGSPIFGYSYLSDDGVTWKQTSRYNFMFSLILSEAP